MFKKLSFPIKYALILSLVIPAIYGLDFFDGLEDGWHDMICYMQKESIPEGDPRIIVASIDDDALQAWGLPPSREMHVKLVQTLKSLGVNTIAFDVLFLEHRPFDGELVAATKSHGRVIHLEKFGGDPPQVDKPVKEIGDAAFMIAHPSVDKVLDVDGHLRRVYMFEQNVADPKTGEPGILLLGAAGYASLTNQSVAAVIKKYSEGEKGFSPELLTLRFRRPKTWTHKSFEKGTYGGWSPYRYVPVDDIIKGRLSAEQRKAFKGALVFVGSTATAYFDHFPSPFARLTPGVETHALAADNALHGDFMKRVKGWSLLPFLLGMIWLALVLVRLPPIAAAGSAVAVGVAWYVGTSAYFVKGTWIDFVAPLAALALSFVGLVVHRVMTEGQEKKFIKNLFGQFVAPEVVDDLAKDPSKVKLGGEKKDLTMFFLDIAHFTDISEKMPPENLIVFLNKYLSALTHVVHENKGVVDKYIGDCVMAFWNAPMPNPDHRANACLAAIQCQQVMQELNAKLQPGEVPILPAIRIGVNSGMATVGLTGSEKKLQYTVIGDEVNLASRLEGANKFFGSKIMASEATYAGAKDHVEARELGPVRVVGKTKPIVVYELLAEKGKLSPEWIKALDHYNMGLALFKQGKYGDAVLSFQEVVKLFPDDGPANLYLNTSKDYSVLPPDVTPVVFNLTAK